MIFRRLLTKDHLKHCCVNYILKKARSGYTDDDNDNDTK